MLNQFFFNHLWQSTLFAGVAWLLTLALRKNTAQTRYWVWMASSIKFLLPFSLLVGLASLMVLPSRPMIAPTRLSTAIHQVSEPFSEDAPGVALPSTPSRSNPVPQLLL